MPPLSAENFTFTQIFWTSYSHAAHTVRFLLASAFNFKTKPGSQNPSPPSYSQKSIFRTPQGTPPLQTLRIRRSSLADAIHALLASLALPPSPLFFQIASSREDCIFAPIPLILPQTLTSLAMWTSKLQHPFQPSITRLFQIHSFPLHSTSPSLPSSFHAQSRQFPPLGSWCHSSHGESDWVETPPWTSPPLPQSISLCENGKSNFWVESIPFCAKSPATRPKRRSEGGVWGVKNRRFLRHQEG